MTPKQIELVRASVTRIAPIADQLGPTFYENLFLAHPEYRAMFQKSVNDQGHLLMHMVIGTVDSLHDLPRLVPILREMGRRHGGYGVRDRDYEAFGEALIETLDQALGDGFRGEMREAWSAVYRQIAGVMRQAANPTLTHQLPKARAEAKKPFRWEKPLAYTGLANGAA